MRTIIFLMILMSVSPFESSAGTVVENPADPSEPRLVLEAVEEWSVGGIDDEEVLFGVIAGVDLDSQGNLYVSDRQLTEVSKFSPSGEFLGFIGREGEGPGEYRRIGRLFVSSTGEVAVIQRMPGRIIPVRQDGTPGTTIELPDFLEGAPAYFFSADAVGSDLVLSVRQFQRTDTGATFVSSLLRVDSTGQLLARMSESAGVRDMTMTTIDERDNVEILWTSDGSGRLFVYDGFDDYVVKVFDPDGTLSHEIRREYVSRRRNEREKQENMPRMAIRSRGGQRRDLEGIPSDTDRDVQALFARPDGTLWVISSRGALDTPDGVLVTMDEFDAEGHFVRQVDILGEGSFKDDGLYIDGDRLFILRGLRAAQDAERGNGDDEDSDAEPMSVVACRLYPVGD